MNANMLNSCVQLNDLPDEILLIIFKNLSNLEVLYSLLSVNKRLNKLVHDSIFTNRLTLLKSVSNGFIDSLPNQILDRFCLHILPEIHDEVEWLNLESFSMERILLATNYPNLYGLGLFNIEEEKAISLFTDKTLLNDALKEQILSFEIRFTDNKEATSLKDSYTLLFAQIFTAFTNLQYLNFDLSSICSQRLSFHISSPAVFSSTLLKLHVNVQYYEDCLYLLNDRFTHLHTFHVNIYSTILSALPIINKEKLPNLKSFSLTQDLMIFAYDEFLIPLLYRMSNLEKLSLNFVVQRDKSFIDGNQLKTKIINNMPRLTNFMFNIRSVICINNQIDLPTNEDIQNTFRNNQIISCVNYFPDINKGQCHIYSYPFTMIRYENIANNFPGGIFNCVREVSLFDEHPFEHEFFLRIQKSFPFMNRLSVKNHKPQSKKLYDESKNSQQLSIIEYLHLTYLNLTHTHDDYVEQFLLDTKMCLPNNVHLYVDYKSLKRVTHNFKRDTTRINSAKVRYLWTNATQFPKHFEDYFHHTDIS